MHRKLIIPSLLVLNLALPGLAQASKQTVQVSVAHTIPKWSKDIGNYVSYCQGGGLNLAARRSSKARVWVDGKQAPVGYSRKSIKLGVGQRTIINTSLGRIRRSYSVRCLPSDFPLFQIFGTLPSSIPLVATGSTNIGFSVAPYGFVVDRHGVPIWWHRSSGNNVMDVKGLPGNQIGMWEGNLINDHSTSDFFVYNPQGQQTRVVRTADGGGGDAHEAQLNSNGNWYRIALQDHASVDLSPFGDPAHAVVDDQIQEIGSDGSLKWSWSALEHLSLLESSRWYSLLKASTPPGEGIDMFHMNSVQEAPDGNLIVSVRYADAVYKIRKSDGRILWKLGGIATPESLAVHGDDEHNGQTFAGQHDARLQVNGQLTVYDNGSGINGRAPRATRWTINQTTHDAYLIEQLVDPQIKWSAAGGSARQMDDGSWLVAWCHQPNIRAYSAQHKKLWEFKFLAPGRPYRAQPILKGWVSARALILGMDAQYPRH